MLKKRLITAAILIPIVLVLIWQPNLAIFNIALILLSSLAIWEWNNFLNFSKFNHKALYLLGFLGLFSLIFFLPVKIILIFAALHWLFAFGFILSFTETQSHIANNKILPMLWGYWVIIPLYFSLSFLKAQNLELHIMALLLTIWGADSFAYFFGKRYGLTKLAARISPGKTYAGFFASFIAPVLIALIFAPLLNYTLGQFFIYLIVLMLTTLLSVYGDLFESMLKRSNNMKDSGNLLPGHGGILDRIDSLTAGAPIFVLALMLLGLTNG